MTTKCRTWESCREGLHPVSSITEKMIVPSVTAGDKLVVPHSVSLSHCLTLLHGNREESSLLFGKFLIKVSGPEALQPAACRVSECI